MGHGCYYTIKADRNVKAYWIELEQDIDELPTDDLFEVLGELPLAGGSYNEAMDYGKHFEIQLIYTHNGDYLIDLELRDEYQPCYELEVSMAERIYKKIIRHINKYYPVHRADTSYTSCTFEIGELGEYSA